MADLYLFGSLVKGEVDRGSDVDILVIDHADTRSMYPDSWSFYPPERIKGLFERGTLFAWHLYLEALPIRLSSEGGWLKRLGPPIPYSTATREITLLRQMAVKALLELESDTPSWVYEFGLLGVAIRDISMAASMPLMGEYCFSKNAPFMLSRVVAPLDKSDYRYLIDCRRATTRGGVVPHDRREWITSLDCGQNILTWCDKVLGLVRSTENGKVS